MGAAEPQAVAAHIQELRTRLLACVVVMLAGGGVAFWQHVALESWLARPLHAPLYYTAPGAAFQYAMLISLAAGAILAIPLTLYQGVAFVSPAVPKAGLKKGAAGVIVAATVLAAGGAAFGYYLLLPNALKFLGSFGSTQIQSLISTTEYLSFAAGCVFTCAALFQLPLILLFIDRITPLPPGRLMGYQRHVVVGSLVLALVLPFTYDPLSQFLIAVPAIGLFELSIVVLWWRHRGGKRQPYLDELPVEIPQPLPPRPIAEAPDHPPVIRRRVVQLG